MNRSTSFIAFTLLIASAAAQAQTPPKATTHRKIMENMDKVLGAQVDGREMAEREYRICTFDVADKLLPNRVDSSVLLAQAASSECSNHLSLIMSFEVERRGAASGELAAEAIRDTLIQEVAFSLAKKRAGYKP